MADRPVTFLAVGDVSPYREQHPEELFKYCAPTIREADLTFTQLEAPYSRRGSAFVSRGMPSRGHPNCLSALKHAGFQVISFAGNHAMDWGVEAFLDTLDGLADQGLKMVGAGRTIEEARQPVIVEVKGARVAFLSYCSIIMGRLSGYIADTDKPGVAPLRAWTHYEPAVEVFDYVPGMPARVITFAYPEDVAAMREDIARVRNQADIVVVSQHAGVTWLHAHVAMYQKEIGRAAVDAGADLVLQHHAHILRGVDFYRGVPIFYGLGDFGHEAPLFKKAIYKGGEGAGKQIRDFYQFKTEPGWEDWPYTLEARITFVVKCLIESGKIARVSYLPAYLNPKMQAQVLDRSDGRAEEVFEYVEEITRSENLSARYTWDGDEVLVQDGGP